MLDETFAAVFGRATKIWPCDHAKLDATMCAKMVSSNRQQHFDLFLAANAAVNQRAWIKSYNS